MGIFDWFRKRPEARETRRDNRITPLTARDDAPDNKYGLRADIDLAQIVRENAEELGDSISDVYATSAEPVDTRSGNESIRTLVRKYNELLLQRED